MSIVMKGKKVAIVYYDGFAPLDVFGPIQAMNCSCGLKSDGKPDPAQSLFEILSVGKEIGLVQSGEASTGPQIYCAYNLLPSTNRYCAHSWWLWQERSCY